MKKPHKMPSARAWSALTECVDNLYSEIEGRYRGIKDYPAMAPKYQRDLEVVTRAYEAIRALRPPKGRGDRTGEAG